MKTEMEIAMKLLEKDTHEKQDTLVALRQQLEEVKAINLQMFHRVQVGAGRGPHHSPGSCCCCTRPLRPQSRAGRWQTRLRAPGMCLAWSWVLLPVTAFTLFESPSYPWEKLIKWGKCQGQDRTEWLSPLPPVADLQS